MIVDSLFGDIWVANNFKFLIIEEQNYLKKNSISNLLINVAKYSNDKIIHSENDELKIFLKFNQLGDEIELVSFNDFVNPSSYSRLVNIPRKIRLVRNDSFMLSKLLKGYLAGVKSIIVVDQYVRKFTGGYLVLKNLLKEGTDLKEIIIKTNFNDKAQQQEDEYINKEKLIGSVKKITGITPTLIQSKIHDRSLILDNQIKIRLSSGLDFVNQDTNKVWRDEISIDVEYLTNE